MERRTVMLVAVLAPVMCLLFAGIYLFPPVHDRLAWRVEELSLKVKYALNPPQKAVFVPQEGLTSTPQDQAVKQMNLGTSTQMPTRTITPEVLLPTATAMPSLEPTLKPSPLPDQVILSGVRYEDQHGRYNYCAPANLAMALSFWGWEGNKDVVGPVIKPDPKDRNVMPYEMVNFIESQAGLGAVERVGGDLDTLKRFIAAGYPVLVERGVYLNDLTGVVSWMGHYQVVTGYDDHGKFFITQDSYIQPDHTVPYDEMIQHWRAFNYTYLVIYPIENEDQVMALLGQDADETVNFQNAALKSANEVYGLSGIDQYFAWYNRGTNLIRLQDYAGASAAYDEAFAIYPTIPEAERPWRMLWYQTGPYFAYFYAQRYYDVLYLSDGTLNAMQGERNLEESYYWRAMAKIALGDTQGAIQDFRTSLDYHQGFEPAIYQMNLLGVTP